MALFAGGRHLRAMLKEAGGVEDFWFRSPSPNRPYSATIPHDSLLRRTLNVNGSQSRSGGCSRDAHSSDSAAQIPVPGLSFFHFAGDHDGEDIKVEFKKRVSEADVILTESEKQDIILEAQHIFRFMVELVDDLDALMGTTEHQSGPVLPRRLARKTQQDHTLSEKEPIIGMSPGGSTSIPPYNSSILKDFLSRWKDFVVPNKIKSVDISSSTDLLQRKVSLPTPSLLVGRACVSFFPIVVIVVLFMAWPHLNIEIRELKALFNLSA
jgi:hypothetical protein